MREQSSIDWRAPVPWLIVSCCVFEALMNMVGGYDLLGGGDGGAKAKLIALAGIVLCGLGAWVAHEGVKAWMRQGAITLFAVVMLAAGTACFAYSQFVSWRVLASSFSDGAAKRDDKGKTFSDLTARKDKLGPQKPLAALEAELDLELRNTSKRYPNGDGPKALILKSQIATAKEVIAIDRQLGEMRQAGGVIKAGSENLIMSQAGFTNEGAIMLLTVMLCALIGFFAYFGFAILEWVNGRYRAADGGAAEMGFDPRALPLVPRLAAPAAQARLAAPDASTVQGRGGWLAPDGGHGGGGGSASAPVNVYVGNVPATLPGAAANSDRPVVHEPGARRAAAAERGSGAPPVDRHPVQQVVDGLAAFHAACVEARAGALVAAGDMYRRYRSWRGEQACGEAAFHSLYPEAAGIGLVTLGGQRHYRHVALRAAKLKEAG